MAGKTMPTSDKSVTFEVGSMSTSMGARVFIKINVYHNTLLNSVSFKPKFINLVADFIGFIPTLLFQ